MKIKVPCPFALLWPTTRISSTLVFGRFYVTTSLPSFIKVGKTPAIQNLVLEQYAVKIDNSTLFLYDKILIYHDCDFKKTRIQKLLNRVEKYRHGMCFRVSSVFVLSILFWFPQRTHYFWRVFRILFMERKQDYNVTSAKNVKVCF